MKYALIALGIQFGALILQINDIGTPVTSVVAIAGLIPVIILNGMGV